MVGNGPITAVENHQSGEERFISWFVLRYSFSLYLSFVAPCDLVYAMDCDVSFSKCTDYSRLFLLPIRIFTSIFVFCKVGNQQ